MNIDIDTKTRKKKIGPKEEVSIRVNSGNQKPKSQV